MLAEYTKQYEQRQQMLHAMEVVYLLAVAPGKEFVYSEFLPESVKPSTEGTVLHQFISAVASVLQEPVLDLGKVLLANKSSGQLCYKLDSHWNFLGAMIASSYLIERVRQHFPSVPRFDSSKFELKFNIESGGDLAKKTRLHYVDGAYISSTEEAATPASECATSIWYCADAREVINHPYQHLSKTRPTRLFKNGLPNNLPRAIIIRDSYADWMIPYLSEYFSEALFIWTRVVDKDVISSFKPDLLIEEVVDRFLIKNRVLGA